MSVLEDRVREFADIAKALPDNLQVTCFELLLRHHLEALHPPPSTTEANSPLPPKTGAASGSTTGSTVEESAKSQEDIALADVHVKARHFLKSHSLSIDNINNIYYKEDESILPLYEDLKTTIMSESQIRIALLQAFRNAIQSGNFEAQVAEVRAECTDRKCNDKSNFAASFKNSKSLFDFDTYTGSTKSVRLSEAGRKKLAEVIKEIQ